MNKEIAVVDYGMGNIHSIDKALKFVASGDNIKVTDKPQDLADADKVVFPGVGAIRDCVAALKSSGLDAAIKQAAKEKPLMAICVGMQALFENNEEDANSHGLGILQGDVKLIKDDGGKAQPQEKSQEEFQERLKVPQIGWNQLNLVDPDHPLYYKIAQNSYFYFVHSYYCLSDDPKIASAKCTYGIEFDAAVLSGNVFATQFHPEKSQDDGLQMLKNFCQWEGCK
ncbi:MAG: imidazole glycerol phosphate synthase subunit HisH [Candidatus Portiera sp.]|nr:imidazole glycerol phosphate synthase subunit HisH [Portiera sp.]